MRYASYYKSAGGGELLYYRWLRKYNRLSVKLGFSVGIDVFGYGLVIPHKGTIVVGGSNRIGNYVVLHTSTCITDNGKDIGDGLYLSTGAVITAKVKLGNNVSIAANSVVNKDYDGNCLLAGAPATIRKETEPWYRRDGHVYYDRKNRLKN